MIVNTRMSMYVDVTKETRAGALAPPAMNWYVAMEDCQIALWSICREIFEAPSFYANASDVESVKD